MAKASKVILDPIDKEILSTIYVQGDLALAYRMWSQHYFNWKPMPMQELMVVAGWNPKALWGDSIVYEDLFTVKNQDILAAIRSGKTLGKGMNLLFLAWAFSGTEWANMGPSVDQAATMFRLLLPFLSQRKFEKFVQRPDGGNNPIQRHPFPVIYLWNGSSIEFRGAGKDYVEQIRSREYDGINVDEAALFSQYAISVLEGRVLGAKAGRKRMGLFSLTTSKRASAAWLRHRAMLGMPDNPNRQPDHLTIEMKTVDNKSLDAKRLASIAAGMSSQLRRQELDNEWIDMGQSLYPQDILVSAFTSIADETGIVKQLEESIAKSRGEEAFDEEWAEFLLPAEPGHYYVAGMDIGKGRRQTKAAGIEDTGARGALAAIVLDVTSHPYRIVGFQYKERTGHWQRAISLARELKKKYQNIEIGWDSTGPGDVIDEVAMESGLEVEFPVKFFGQIIKANMARGLAWALEHGLIKGPFIKLLFNQLQYYQLDDEDLSQDAVIALMIAAHVAREREMGATAGAASLEQPDNWRIPSSREEYSRSSMMAGPRDW